MADPPDEDPEQNEPDLGSWKWVERAFRWGSDNPIGFLAVAGVVLFGTFTLSCQLFYGPLGFTPDEVGLTYVNTITRSIYGAGFLVLIYVGTGYVIEGIVWAMRRLWRAIRRPERPTAEDLDNETAERFRGEWVRVRRGFLGIAIIYLCAWPVLFGWQGASSAKNGRATNIPSFLSLGTPRVAAAAIVHPSDPSVPLSDGQCVLYLGRADGIWALYDPVTDTGYRVPVGLASIETEGTLADVKRVPDDCPVDP